MIIFSGNCYYLSGKKVKVQDLITTTGKDLDSDLELEQWESEISKKLSELIGKTKEAKLNKDKVLFVEFENVRWLETGSFKEGGEKIAFTFQVMEFSPKEFRKMDNGYKAKDKKEFEKPDKNREPEEE